MTAQVEEVVYHESAAPFSEILERLGCEHKDTWDNVEEWEFTKTHGSNEITINYITGEVIIKRYNTTRFLEEQVFVLQSRGAMEKAARAAVTL